MPQTAPLEPGPYFGAHLGRYNEGQVIRLARERGLELPRVPDPQEEPEAFDEALAAACEHLSGQCPPSHTFCLSPGMDDGVWPEEEA